MDLFQEEMEQTAIERIQKFYKEAGTAIQASEGGL